MPGFSMSLGGRGQAQGGLARGRGRGASGGGCALFKLDEEPVRRPVQLLDPSSGAAAAVTGEAAADNMVVDSLDAFMAGVTDEAAQVKKPALAGAFEEKAAWEEMEPDDPVASYCEAFEEGKAGDSGSDASDAELDENEDGERKPKKSVAPLPRVEHSEIEYADAQMDFYKPHSEIAGLTSEQVIGLRSELGISAIGPQCPCPVVSFVHLGLPASLMEGIRRHGYAKPTPIQAQAMPAGLSGRDVVGVAETGSGKTVAYLMPLLVHCAAQPELQKGEGPMGIVLCPTRELAIQVEKETFKFNKLLGLRSTTLAGGLSKKAQFKDIKKGSEIIIGTPGRMVDIVKMKGFNFQRCTVIVMDEADRMLDMGFEYQVRSIAQNIRPNRQTMLFSATLPPKIERLASDLLRNPVRIVVGELGRAAASVTQAVEVLENDDAKWPWLSKRVKGMLSKGQLLVFVREKKATEVLVQNFSDLLEIEAVALHGDLDQGARMTLLDSFRARKVEVLVATDLAARGLDVPTIRTVVSYDVARDIETHTHRIGRTGRAGVEGEAFTLLTDEKHSRKMAAELFSSLQQNGAAISKELADLASKHIPFRAAQMKGRGKGQLQTTESHDDAPASVGQSEQGRLRSRSRSRSRSGSPPLR